MLQTYGKGTNLPHCKECGRSIFITEAEVILRDGKRLVELKCVQPGCGHYNRPTLYDEVALEIRSAV
jgi:hypothetical protein